MAFAMLILKKQFCVIKSNSYQIWNININQGTVVISLAKIPLIPCFPLAKHKYAKCSTRLSTHLAHQEFVIVCYKPCWNSKRCKCCILASHYLSSVLILLQMAMCLMSWLRTNIFFFFYISFLSLIYSAHYHICETEAWRTIFCSFWKLLNDS